MNLPAVIAAHKVPVLAAGAAGAVALGLRARKKSAASATTPGVSYQGQGGVYDSTANDVYNSIQPQIEGLAAQIAALAAAQTADALNPDKSHTEPVFNPPNRVPAPAAAPVGPPPKTPLARAWAAGAPTGISTGIGAAKNALGNNHGLLIPAAWRR